MGFNAETEGRVARVEISVYDAMLAEILGEHIAEKCRVRNRRKADRKAKRKSGAYVKRNGGDFRKDEHYAGDGRMWHDTYNWELSKSQTGGKIRERSLRKDYDAEIRQHEDALAEYDDYVYWADEHDRRYRTIRRYLLDLPLRGDLNHLRNMTEELTREMRYEECRIKDMCENARIIWEGECY